MLVSSCFVIPSSLLLIKNFGLLCILLHLVALFQAKFSLLSIQAQHLRDISSTSSRESGQVLVTLGYNGPQDPSYTAFQDSIHKDKPREFQGAQQECLCVVRVREVSGGGYSHF